MEHRQNKISDVIDQGFSGYQCLVILLCFLIALLDGFDTQAVAFTGPAIIDAFHLEAKALAPVLTAGIIGMTIGAMGLGIVGDKWGRRITLMICVLLFGLATLFTAFATQLEHIFILRILAGLGMGGATPVLLALPLAYYLPKLNTIKILSFMFICGILIAAALGLSIQSQQWGLIFIFIALAGFGVGGQQLALNYLVIASYPAEVRATATGWAIGMGRLGAILGSAIGGTILAASGVTGYFFALIVPLMLAFICVLAIRKSYRTHAMLDMTS